MSIKVMIGRNGVPRIQEETGDSVRVWTHDDWQAELKRRQEAKVVKPVEAKKPVKDADGLEDDDEEMLGAVPPKKVVKRKSK